jgi:cytochrome bd-type quinol oxidase subunit 2
MLRRLLAFLLVVWAPLNLSITAAALLNSLADRGWPAIVLLIVRLAVTGFGVAAGRALWNQRRGAIGLARWATGLSLGAVLVTATTSIWPYPLPPGVREPVAIATVAWHALWFLWTLRQQEIAEAWNEPQSR